MMFWEAEYMGKSRYSLASFFSRPGRDCRLQRRGGRGRRTLTRLTLAAALPRILLMIKSRGPELEEPETDARSLSRTRLRITWDADVTLKALTLTAQAWQA